MQRLILNDDLCRMLAAGEDMIHMRYQGIQDLPRTIPVFPLPGVVLFPRGTLPINVFEPRYLQLVDDALGMGRLFGMIQPDNGLGAEGRPQLAPVGCLGGITSFAETDDGRYVITLTGICRFHLDHELDVSTPYRQISANYQPFAADFTPPEDPLTLERPMLKAALRRYVEVKSLRADWSSMDEVSSEALVNGLGSLLPFGPLEKQEMLEAPTLIERCHMLIGILELHGSQEEENGGRLH